MSNIIRAIFNNVNDKEVFAKARYQYDYGMVLRFEGAVTLPSAYEVHFALARHGEAITQIGNSEGVPVPDALFLAGKTIYAWAYLHSGEDDGYTEYMVQIPVIKRAQPSDEVPTPVQQSAIDQAIAALGVAVEQTAADVETTTEKAAEAQASAEAAAASAAEAAETAENVEENVTAARAAKAAAEAARDRAVQAETSAGQSKTAAATSETNAAASASAAATSATNAASSASDANTSASTATSAKNTAVSKASEATTAASTATTKASEASASATAAAGSATTASTKASEAAASATTASTAASTATTKAGEAATSATNAAASAKSVASSAAQITQNAEDIDALKEDLNAIREVELPLGTMTTGVYIDGSGGESSDSGSKVTDYIYIGDRVTDVLELEDVFVRGSRCCALYNASKTFTRYISDGTDTRNFEVTLTSDEQYIRLTARVADTPRIYFNKIIRRANAYVSNANGDDSNDGTLYAPYKTIQKAVDNGHKNIFVDATSEYADRVYLYNLSDITIQPWFYRTYDTSVPDNTKIKINCGNSINSGVIINLCSNITLIGIEAYNTTQYGFFFTNCENLKCFSCVAHDTFMDGFKLTNVDGIFENCIAYNVGDSSLTHADGFNIHGYGATSFKNCIAHDCLDDGISHHDACTGVIDGGEYYNCGKGGVASPTHGAQINVYNVRSHHNAYGLYTALEEGKTQKNSIIANCLFHDNSNAGILANGYTLIGFSNVLRNNARGTQTLSGGVYILYESNQ